MEKKKSKKQSNSKYQINSEKVERKLQTCPKCGEGTFLAEHKDRQHCGKCMYTRWKN